MKQFLLSIGAAALVLAPASTVFATEGPANNSRYVNPGEVTYACTYSGSGLYMRSAINGSVLASIPEGHPMRVISRHTYNRITYFYVEAVDVNGDVRYGYVRASYACPDDHLGC